LFAYQSEKMAARDFGPAEFGQTKYGKRMVVYDSQENPGHRFEFSYWSKDKAGVTEYFGCIACRVMKEKDKKDGEDLWTTNAVPKVTVRGGRIVNSNPENPTNGAHFCSGTRLAKSEAVQLDRETRSLLRTGVKRPLHAFQDAEASIHTKFSKYDYTVRDEIERDFPKYSEVHYLFYFIIIIIIIIIILLYYFILNIFSHNVRVKGCVFHFTKALNTKKDHLGLQTT
jgi:preprotein translocase subunit SecE